MRTADGVEITQGLRVITTDMRVGTVELSPRRPGHAPYCDPHNGEWWFLVIHNGDPEDWSFTSESRVATRDPGTGKAV